MLDGDWDLRIQYGAQIGHVRLTLKGNNIAGDDGHHSYSGTVKTDLSGKSTVEVHIKRHIPGAGPSFNNLDDYVLLIVGPSTDNAFNGVGGVKGSQDRMFKINAIRAT